MGSEAMSRSFMRAASIEPMELRHAGKPAGATEPRDRARQGLLGRSGGEAEFAGRLFMGDPHLLAGHDDSAERYAGSHAGEIRPGGTAHAGAIRYRIGEL